MTTSVPLRSAGLDATVTSDSEGRVCVDFGVPLTWMELSKKDAVELAVALLKYATDGAAVQINVGRGPVSHAKPEEKKDG